MFKATLAKTLIGMVPVLVLAMATSAAAEVKPGRGFLGFGWQAMIAPDGVHALRILNVVADSPAKKAGLQKDDVAVSINGIPVKLPPHWESAPIENPFAAVRIGDRLVLKVRRGGQELELAMIAIEDSRTSAIAAGEQAAMQRYEANKGVVLVSSMLERGEQIVLRRTPAGLLQIVKSSLAGEEVTSAEKALNGVFSEVFKSLAVGEHELVLDEKLTPPFRKVKLTAAN